MRLEGDGFWVTHAAGVIVISGKLSLMLEDYADLENFFQKVIDSEPSELILDLRSLEYLNSSGIKTLCVGLLLEAEEVDGLRMKILCSDKYTWQRETIPTFEDLMERMEIVFEG